MIWLDREFFYRCHTTVSRPTNVSRDSGTPVVLHRFCFRKGLAWCDELSVYLQLGQIMNYTCLLISIWQLTKFQLINARLAKNKTTPFFRAWLLLWGIGDSSYQFLTQEISRCFLTLRGLKYSLARQILHFSPQNAPQCQTKWWW